MPKPKTALRLQPAEKGPEGYLKTGLEGVFQNKSLRVAASIIKDTEGGPGLIGELLGKKYVVIRLDIENRSSAKVIYNPTHTVLTNDALDYRKPLDYTDLYDIKGSSGERELAQLRGRFYDLTVTLLPGERSSRLLIFEPMSKGVKKAELSIKEIYIGTDTIRVSFPFEAKEGI